MYDGQGHDLRKVATFRMTPNIAEKRVKELAADSENIAFATHAHERMAERDIVVKDVLRVLRDGTIKGEPERTPRNEWKVKMVKQIKGSRAVGVITILLKNNRLLVKTVEWEDVR